MTIAQGISRLIAFREAFKEKLEAKDITVSTENLNEMLDLVDDINTGGMNYASANIVTGKTNALSFGTFNFLPESFALASSYNIGNQYTFNQEPFEVICYLSLNGITIGTKTHTVEIMNSNQTYTTITVTTLLVKNNGNYTLTVTLPTGYFFIGECEWAVMSEREELVEE